MDKIGLHLTSEQEAAIEEIQRTGDIDSRLVDLADVMRSVCREHPDLFVEASSMAVGPAKALVDRWDDLRSLLQKGDTLGFEKFIDPLLRLFNATTNGMDRKISADYFNLIDKLNERIREVLLWGAVLVDKRESFADEYRILLDKWLEAHAMELAIKYDEKGLNSKGRRAEFN